MPTLIRVSCILTEQTSLSLTVLLQSYHCDDCKSPLKQLQCSVLFYTSGHWFIFRYKICRFTNEKSTPDSVSPIFKQGNCVSKLENWYIQYMERPRTLYYTLSVSDVCDSMPCFYDGTCFAQDWQYTCLCHKGVTGIYCESGIYCRIFSY